MEQLAEGLRSFSPEVYDSKPSPSTASPPTIRERVGSYYQTRVDCSGCETGSIEPSITVERFVYHHTGRFPDHEDRPSPVRCSPLAVLNSDKALAERIDRISDQLRAWGDEMEKWYWPAISDFNPPVPKGTYLSRSRGPFACVARDGVVCCGPLSLRYVEALEARVNWIDDELEAYDIAGLKVYLYNMIVESRGTTGFSNPSEFILSTTTAVLQMLSLHVKVKYWLERWSNRLWICRRADRFVAELDFAQKATEQARAELARTVHLCPATTLAVDELRHATETIQNVLFDKIRSLGRQLNRYEALQAGRTGSDRDHVPSRWIREYEQVMDDYCVLVADSQMRLVALEVEVAMAKENQGATALELTQTPVHGDDNDSDPIRPQDIVEGVITGLPAKSEQFQEVATLDASAQRGSQDTSDADSSPVGPTAIRGVAFPGTFIQHSSQGGSDVESSPTRSVAVPEPAQTFVQGSSTDVLDLNATHTNVTDIHAADINAVIDDTDVHAAGVDAADVIVDDVRTDDIERNDVHGSPGRPKDIQGVTATELVDTVLQHSDTDSTHVDSSPVGPRNVHVGVTTPEPYSSPTGPNDNQEGATAPELSIIKLFVRPVGDNGERIMVRVGGGWAELREYFTHYIDHHGYRHVSKVKFELHGLPADCGTPGPMLQDITKKHNNANHRSRNDHYSKRKSPERAPSVTTPRRSFDVEEIGAARSVSAKKVDLSQKKRDWIEGMVEKTRRLTVVNNSGSGATTPILGSKQNKAGEFRGLGKVGETRRVFNIQGQK